MVGPLWGLCLHNFGGMNGETLTASNTTGQKFNADSGRQRERRYSINTTHVASLDSRSIHTCAPTGTPSSGDDSSSWPISLCGERRQSSIHLGGVGTSLATIFIYQGTCDINKGRTPIRSTVGTRL